MRDSTKEACKICGNRENNAVFTVKEMMFGSGEEFDYLECRQCGCLQLIEVPADMSVYYSKDYYAFRAPEVFEKCKHDNPSVRFLRRQRTAYLLRGRNMLGFFLQRLNPAQERLAGYVRLLRGCGSSLSSKILDVGCGGGRLVAELYWYGFRDLTGIDPYVFENRHLKNAVKILKMDVFSLDDTFDIIILNHSFEHMEKPGEVLKKIRRLLAPNGCVLIRIPTVSSYAWEHYRQHWVALDAPRHLFLHSRTSLEMLVKEAKLRVDRIECDSSEFQFWGSEQYLRGIPLVDPRSLWVATHSEMFTSGQIEQFKKQAQKLNEQQRGDRLCVFLSGV